MAVSNVNFGSSIVNCSFTSYVMTTVDIVHVYYIYDIVIMPSSYSVRTLICIVMAYHTLIEICLIAMY